MTHSDLQAIGFGFNLFAFKGSAAKQQGQPYRPENGLSRSAGVIPRTN